MAKCVWCKCSKCICGSFNSDNWTEFVEVLVDDAEVIEHKELNFEPED